MNSTETTSAQAWFGHPPGLTILFLTETWEAFSYYGMRTILVYYMTGGLKFEQGRASMIYGLYTACALLTPIFGGFIADRYLSRRRAVLIGAVVMALGHFMMISPSLLFPALATIAAGNGLFLPNLPGQIPALYSSTDPRITTAYSVYYVGINIGAFFAPIVCGALGEFLGWHWGFGAAGIGMLVGAVIYARGQRWLPDVPPARASLTKSSSFGADERSRLYFLGLVTAGALIFRAAYEQCGNTVMLWAQQGVDRSLGHGWSIPMTWFISLNPLCIFILTPFLVRWWSARATQRGSEIPALQRMATGAALVALSYLVLALASARGEPSHWVWLAAYWVLLTIGELHILPVGLSLFGRLAPRGLEATCIALWFSAASIGNFAAGMLGTLWSSQSHATFFSTIAAVSIMSSLALWIIYRFVGDIRVHNWLQAGATSRATR